MRIFIFLLILVAVIVGTVALQVYLSKQESKWLGLILPIMTFLLSLVVVMGVAVFYQVDFENNQVTLSQYFDGEWIEVEVENPTLPEATTTHGRIPGAIGTVVYLFILFNMPTAILLVIYKAVRGKQNSRREIERMSVQDL